MKMMVNINQLMRKGLRNSNILYRQGNMEMGKKM